MGEGNSEPQRRQPTVIDRPRLRALIDASPARVILLTAPAGYGKTTLAHQWLAESERFAYWHTCRPASADIAALSLSLARGAPDLFPGAAGRLESRLRNPRAFDEDPSVLAELLTEAPPRDETSWLVLDDYQHIMLSSEAERFVAGLVDLQKVFILIASRRRPSWATARRLVYGELREIPRELLAMTPTEAAQVLREKGSRARRLIEIADGWPAVIGLAARSGFRSVPNDKLAPQLYDFFAQELYEAAAPSVRRDLHRLAMTPSITARHLRLIFHERTDSVVDELIRLGFLTSSIRQVNAGEEPVSLHPLVRDFLADKIAALPEEPVRIEATEVAQILSDASAWDASFDVVRTFRLSGLLPSLFELALEPLLEEGRTATVHRWLELAQQLKLRSPVIELANAELALRRGAWREALTLATAAAESFPTGHLLTSRAFNCAARAAHFSDQSALAVQLHTRARATAIRPQDVRQSLWGKFVAESERDHADEARSTLQDYERLTVCDGDDLVRRTTGRLVLAVRHGPLFDALRIAPATLSVLESAEDPITKTGFLQMYSYVMTLAGRYKDAHESAVAEVELARAYELEFIEIHALCALAAAHIGRRQLAAADAALDRAEEKLRRVDDVHAEMAVSAARMKIGLLRGDHALRLGETERVWTRAPNSGMQGDILAIRGLVYARKGRHDLAMQTAAEAERVTSQLEARIAAKCLHAVCAVEREGHDGSTASLAALEAADSTGALDPFIFAYRTFPSILRCFVGTPSHERAAAVIRSSGDRAIGIQSGILTPSSPQKLSKREREVLELIARGLSNRAIARALWITESTAKVHVRHIFDKLEVRTRTEAALIAHEYLAESERR